MAHRRRQTDRQPRPGLQRHGRQHGEIHRQGDHGHRAAQRREHPHVRRLPEARRLETRHAPDSRNEVAFGLQPRGPRRQKDRQAAQEIRRAGPYGDHRLLDQRLHGIQEAHSRHQNLLPQRRPGSQEHQETGAVRHRLLDEGAPQKSRMGEAGPRPGTRSQRLDRGRRGGHEIFHRPGRGLHHHRLPRASAGPAEEIGVPIIKRNEQLNSLLISLNQRITLKLEKTCHRNEYNQLFLKPDHI